MAHANVSKYGPVSATTTPKSFTLAWAAPPETDKEHRCRHCLDQSGTLCTPRTDVGDRRLAMQRGAEIHNLVDRRGAGKHLHPYVLVDTRDPFA